MSLRSASPSPQTRNLLSACGSSLWRPPPKIPWASQRPDRCSPPLRGVPSGDRRRPQRPPRARPPPTARDLAAGGGPGSPLKRSPLRSCLPLDPRHRTWPFPRQRGALTRTTLAPTGVVLRAAHDPPGYRSRLLSHGRPMGWFPPKSLGLGDHDHKGDRKEQARCRRRPLAPGAHGHEIVPVDLGILLCIAQCGQQSLDLPLGRPEHPGGNRRGDQPDAKADPGEEVVHVCPVTERQEGAPKERHQQDGPGCPIATRAKEPAERGARRSRWVPAKGRRVGARAAKGAKTDNGGEHVNDHHRGVQGSDHRMAPTRAWAVLASLSIRSGGRRTQDE